MIEALKDMKHGRPPGQVMHGMEDSLECTRTRVLANARAIYGPCRHLDVISFAPTSSRKIGAAIVEHNPTGRSYIHCSSAREDTRIAAVEHLLVITEDIIQRLVDAEGITSSGWLPATPQSQHAAAYNASVAGSVMGGSTVPSLAGSVLASQRSSVQPSEHMHDHSPHYSNLSGLHMAPGLIRNNSDLLYQTSSQPSPLIPRHNSDLIQQPKPLPVGQFHSPRNGRVQWNLGSEG
ncbi:hypothetical protein BDV95DRAFT_151058 [Massariosphaeria phaeospora]|uniref:Uncharacterized protein n=1 Tax=Massariosphaeria phaeospora TaxID=100035 RepID=A0A7C8IQ03_9PLEO|nr:hypothetical protein BDV95DRAFT_151058 [Massariosphaeria phaeospora]